MRDGKAWGWSDERRARQAAAIRGWQPWTKSTGPRTLAGKATSARNAVKSNPLRAELLAIMAELRDVKRKIRQVEARRRARGKTAPAISYPLPLIAPKE